MTAPRNPQLDRQLALEGPKESTLSVYGDWLAQRGHPELARSLADQRLAGVDRQARARLSELRAQQLQNPAGLMQLSWIGGAAVHLQLSLLRDWGSSYAAPLLTALEQPQLALLTQVSCELRRNEDSQELLDLLYLLPPSVGRVSLCEPSMPARTEEPHLRLDLSMLELPCLRDLRIRAEAVLDWPPQLQDLQRLQLGVCALQRLPDRLPALTELHLWAGLGPEATHALLRRTHALSVLGLHGPGALRLLSHGPLPPTIRTLVLGVEQLDPEALPGLLAALPATLERVQLPWLAPQPLPAPLIAGEGSEQAPIYLG